MGVDEQQSNFIGARRCKAPFAKGVMATPQGLMLTPSISQVLIAKDRSDRSTVAGTLDQSGNSTSFSEESQPAGRFDATVSARGASFSTA
jgi:hypothetical protein